MDLFYIHSKVSEKQWKKFRDFEETHYIEVVSLLGKDPSVCDPKVLNNLSAMIYLSYGMTQHAPYLFDEKKMMRFWIFYFLPCTAMLWIIKSEGFFIPSDSGSSAAACCMADFPIKLRCPMDFSIGHLLLLWSYTGTERLRALCNRS